MNAMPQRAQKRSNEFSAFLFIARVMLCHAEKYQLAANVWHLVPMGASCWHKQYA